MNGLARAGTCQLACRLLLSCASSIAEPDATGAPASSRALIESRKKAPIMASQGDPPSHPKASPRVPDSPRQVVHRLSLAPRVPRAQSLRALIARFLFP